MQQTLTNAYWLTSPYYHVLNNFFYSQQLDFTNGLLHKLDLAPGSAIVQAGCGTGEITKAIAAKGYDVTGIDPATENIEFAKKSVAENLNFFLHDTRLPFWINYFDCALNLFSSFGMYNTLREHDNAVRVLAQSMKMGGLFVMDYVNVRYEEDNINQVKTEKVDNISYKFSSTQDTENFYRHLEVIDGGKTKGTLTEKRAKISIGDFTDMFAFQGLQIQEVFGDYSLSEYNLVKSPRLIFIAKKIRR